MSSELRRVDEQTLEFKGVRFLITYDPKLYEVKSTLDRFLLLKDEVQLHDYLKLGQKVAPERIVELGIWQGGSTVFFDKAFRPKKMVAFELGQPVPALSAYIEHHGLQDRIKLNYKVNQADRGTIAAVLDREFPNQTIDLVIDDASHLLRETRASFNLIFPRLRPGGAYVIEDWAWAHWRRMWEGPLGATPPLTNLIFELVMTAARGRDIISSVTVLLNMVIVERGTGQLGDDFDISKSYVIRDPRDYANLFSPNDDATLPLGGRIQRIAARHTLFGKALRAARGVVRRRL